MKCYARLVKIKSCQTTSALTIQNAKLDTQKTVYLWTGFNSLLSVEDCPVCSLFEIQKKGGRPAKRKRVSQKPDYVLSAVSHSDKRQTIDQDSSALSVSTFPSRCVNSNGKTFPPRINLMCQPTSTAPPLHYDLTPCFQTTTPK